MRIAALVTWLLAALVGSYLLRTWVAHGGLPSRQRPRDSRFAPILIFGHGGLAACGLLVWISYLLAGATQVAWAAFAVLMMVAPLGATMFGLWIRAGHGLPRGRHAFRPRHAAAEDHFPPPAVVGHGLFAVTTVVLVLLTALGVNG